MESCLLRSLPFCGAIAPLSVAVAVMIAPQPSFALTAVTGCGVVITEVDGKRVWRHTIDLTAPEDKNCKILFANDSDNSWVECAERTGEGEDNPITQTCDDPLDNENFDRWKGKAVCDGQNLIAYCFRDRAAEGK
jgi:hypothetical protein